MAEIDREKVSEELLAIKAYFASQAIAKEGIIKEVFIEAQQTIENAISMLKDREPKYVNSIAQQISCFSGTCPKCGKMLNTTCNKNFCGDCGQELKWDD